VRAKSRAAIQAVDFPRKVSVRTNDFPTYKRGSYEIQDAAEGTPAPQFGIHPVPRYQPWGRQGASHPALRGLTVFLELSGI